MNAFFHFLQNIDRRWIYLALSIVLVVSLILGKPETPVVLPSAQQLYDALEAAPAGPDDGKIILVGTTFSAGTMGESGNQARVLIRHLMLSHKRFATLAVSEPQGAELGKMIATELAPRYGYKYGTDWIAFGFQVGTLAFFKAFPKDIIANIKVDAVEKKPLANFPIMARVKKIDDVAMLLEITASASVFDWIQIVQPATEPRLKIGYACTGVMAAEAYPYLDSGQLIGMIPGLKGAADYEKLVDDQEARAIQRGDIAKQYDAASSFMKLQSARKLMYTQSAAHMVIIAFIFIGNIGMLLARRKPREAAQEETHG